MAHKKRVQYTPITPLIGVITATVCGDTAPNSVNQIEVAEDANTVGVVVDLILLKLVLG